MQTIQQAQSDSPLIRDRTITFPRNADEKKLSDSASRKRNECTGKAAVSKIDEALVKNDVKTRQVDFELVNCKETDKTDSPADREDCVSTPKCSTIHKEPLERLNAPTEPASRVLPSSNLKAVQSSSKAKEDSSSSNDIRSEEIIESKIPTETLKVKVSTPQSDREVTPTVVLSTGFPIEERPLDNSQMKAGNCNQTVDKHSVGDERDNSPSEIIGSPVTTRIDIDRLEPPSAGMGTPTASTGPLISYTEDPKIVGAERPSTGIILPGHEQIVPVSIALAHNNGFTEEEIRVARLRELRWKIERSGQYDIDFPQNFANIFYNSSGESYGFAQNYWNLCIEMLADDWCTFEIFKLYLKPWTYKVPGLGNPKSQDISEIYTEIFKNNNRSHPPKMFKLFWICLLEHEVSLTREMGQNCYLDLIGHLAFRSAVVYCFPVSARMIWNDLDEEDVRLDSSDWEYIFSTLFNNFTIPPSELLLTIRFICREIAEDVEMFTNPEDPVKVEDALQYVTWNTEILLEMAYSLPHYEFKCFYPQIKQFIGSFMHLYNCTSEVEQRVLFALDQGVNMRNFREKKKTNTYFHGLFPVVCQLKEWDPSLVNLIISFI